MIWDGLADAWQKVNREAKAARAVREVEDKKLRDYFALPELCVEELFQELAAKYGLICYSRNLYSAPMIRSEPVENTDPNRNFFAIWYYGKMTANYFMYTYKFGNNRKDNEYLNPDLTVKQLIEFIETMIVQLKKEKIKTRLNNIQEDF